MKIGLLAYHAACNFGANLQILSTYNYLKNNNCNPVLINWVAEDLERNYKKNVSETQHSEHKKYVLKHFEKTELCRNSEEIASVIVKENIDAVVIGSDAVAQCHKTSVLFPSRRIISIIKPTTDKSFPNPFWGEFNNYLENPIPLAFLSASNQNSRYKKLKRDEITYMNELLKNFSYISTRDTWTKNMFNYISGNKISPDVTPDPVFAFNQNVGCPSKEEILKKFDLPEKYILVSFLSSHYVSENWINSFKNICDSNGLLSVALPFPEGLNFNHSLDKTIELPLNPIDWYALIKYSSGYVGNNMHPIVVALHNCVPFYSFDHYGVTYLRSFLIKKSSKIYDLLDDSIFIKNRFSSANIFSKNPSPKKVFNKIQDFDFSKCDEFSKLYYSKYINMMNSLVQSLKDRIKK